MSSGKRPGGLTALAVVNFIFAGFGIIGAIGFAVALPLLRNVPEQAQANMPPEQLARFEAIRDVGASIYLSLGALTLISAALLLISGIGYLKLKKVLGRTLGNVYGVLGIAVALGSVLWLPEVLSGGFTIATIIRLIYPVLTLILLNTTFREDFVN